MHSHSCPFHFLIVCIHSYAVVFHFFIFFSVPFTSKLICKKLTSKVVVAKDLGWLMCCVDVIKKQLGNEGKRNEVSGHEEKKRNESK